MESLIADFNNLEVCQHAMNIITQDIEYMACHYIGCQSGNTHVEFMPNLMYETHNIDADVLNNQILKKIKEKGEHLLIKRIKILSPECVIDNTDVSSIIDYYISLFESLK